MIKILLDYDAVSGTIYDPMTGNMITTYAGLEKCEANAADSTEKIDQVVRLANAGVSVDDMMRLYAAGMLK